MPYEHKANFTPPMIYDGHRLMPFMAWTQSIIPQVYTNSLSYVEVLYQTLARLNEAMKDINDLGEDVTNLRDAYVKLQDDYNTEYDKLRSEWEDLKGDWNNYENKLNEAWEAFKNEQTERQNEFENDQTERQNEFETTMSRAWEEYKVLLTGDFEELKQFVNNYFNNLDLRSEVMAILNEYLEDGTLKNLLDQIFTEHYGTAIEHLIVDTNSVVPWLAPEAAIRFNTSPASSEYAVSIGREGGFDEATIFYGGKTTNLNFTLNQFYNSLANFNPKWKVEKVGTNTINFSVPSGMALVWHGNSRTFEAKTLTELSNLDNEIYRVVLFGGSDLTGEPIIKGGEWWERYMLTQLEWEQNATNAIVDSLTGDTENMGTNIAEINNTVTRIGESNATIIKPFIVANNGTGQVTLTGPCRVKIYDVDTKAYKIVNISRILPPVFSNYFNVSNEIDSPNILHLNNAGLPSAPIIYNYVVTKQGDEYVFSENTNLNTTKNNASFYIFMDTTGSINISGDVVTGFQIPAEQLVSFFEMVNQKLVSHGMAINNIYDTLVTTIQPLEINGNGTSVVTLESLGIFSLNKRIPENYDINKYPASKIVWNWTKSASSTYTKNSKIYVHTQLTESKWYGAYASLPVNQDELSLYVTEISNIDPVSTIIDMFIHVDPAKQTITFYGGAVAEAIYKTSINTANIVGDTVTSNTAIGPGRVYKFTLPSNYNTDNFIRVLSIEGYDDSSPTTPIIISYWIDHTLNKDLDITIFALTGSQQARFNVLIEYYE